MHDVKLTFTLMLCLTAAGCDSGGTSPSPESAKSVAKKPKAKPNGDRKAAEGHSQRAIRLLVNGKLPQALAEVDKAIKLDPSLAKAWLVRGDIHCKQGKAKTAVGDYTKAIEARPDYVRALTNRGALYGQGWDGGDVPDDLQLEKGVADLKKALSFDAKNAMAYANLGAIYSRLGKPQLAIDSFESAIKAEPRFEGRMRPDINKLKALIAKHGRRGGE